MNYIEYVAVVMRTSWMGATQSAYERVGSSDMGCAMISILVGILSDTVAGMCVEAQDLVLPQSEWDSYKRSWRSWMMLISWCFAFAGEEAFEGAYSHSWPWLAVRAMESMNVRS